DIVGKAVNWTVQASGARQRVFHGFVRRFTSGASQLQGLREYRAEVVPWLWFLTQTSTCRVFQKKPTPQIVKTVFAGFGFSDHAFSLRSAYAPREYCVQYRETAFAFVSRLLEEEGIFYFFKHQEGKHTLVLADQKSAYEDCLEKEAGFEHDPQRFGGLLT